MIESVKKGFSHGLEIAWSLGKICIPVYILIEILKATGLMDLIAQWCTPITALMGLPGEATVVLASGSFLSLYAALGSIPPLGLTAKEVTIIAIFLLIAHSLIMEGAVIKKSGLNPWAFSIFRILAAFASACLLNFLWQSDGGRGTTAQSISAVSLSGKTTMDAAWAFSVCKGAFFNFLEIACIVMVIMILIEILQYYHLVEKAAPVFRRPMHFLGLPEDAIIPILAGMIFGFVYGAGVILYYANRGTLDSKDMFTINLILSICHSVLEDHILFAAVGANIWIALSMRIILAGVLATVWARVICKNHLRLVERQNMLGQQEMTA